MKYACIFLLLAGCAGGGHNIKRIEEAPPSFPDSSLAILEKKIEKLESRLQRKPMQKALPAVHDSAKIIDWPDDQVFKFILFYRNLDTQGNPIPEPEVRFQYEQFNTDTAIGYSDLRDRSDQSESDYWISHDTLYVNVPFLRWFNPSPTGEYIFMWRFRVRLEDFFDPRKNSGWIYSRLVLNLIRADRWDGVPQKPVLIEVH